MSRTRLRPQGALYRGRSSTVALADAPKWSTSAGCRLQRASGRRLSAPAPRARDVDSHALLGTTTPLLVCLAGGHHIDVAATDLCNQLAAMRLALPMLSVSPSSSCSDRAKQRSLATRPSTQIEPCVVGSFNVHRGESNGDKLASLVLNAGPPFDLPPEFGPHYGAPRSPPQGRTSLALRPSADQLIHRRSPWTGNSRSPVPGIFVGIKKRFRPVSLRQGKFELVNQPTRMR